ncbi:HK97 family phage prohead protease [Treponema primitia]|uniref:HK97 family phage prohead protease n=1 Tax=Treponema primitia TaxID=88058 RepID=UPI003980FEBF
MVILRNKGGEFQVQDRAGLLGFLRGELGLHPTEGGKKVVNDLGLECVCAVPFAAFVKDGEGQESAVAWTFSTFDLDRYDERVDPAGWDFKRYLQNPVIEWAHRYDIPAIGRADGLHADDTGLHGSIIFNNKDYDPFGWSIGERVKAGVIRAGSVGFRVLEIELPDKQAAEDGTTLIFRKQELLEFSICNVPANPYALRKSFTSSDGEVIPIDLTAARQFWGGFMGGAVGV